MRAKATLLAGLLTAAAGALNAHDLFIKLDSFFVEPNTQIQVPVLNGTFSVSENAITSDRVLDLSLVSGGSRKRLATTLWTAAGDTTWLTLQTGASGSYVVGVSTRARDLELSAADFNEYLEHDGIPDVLQARRQSGELARDVVERYHKHVKAVFQVGERRSDDFAEILGYPAEIIPLDNPYSLEVGGILRIRCLVDGNPVARQLVIAGGDGSAGVISERSARTDADGMATFRVDGPGKWYVKFIHMVRSPEEGIDYESKWATLSFEVR